MEYNVGNAARRLIGRGVRDVGLFEGELTEGDAVSFVETIGNSPNLNEELMNALMDAMAAHESMGRQALNPYLYPHLERCNFIIMLA